MFSVIVFFSPPPGVKVNELSAIFTLNERIGLTLLSQFRDAEGYMLIETHHGTTEQEPTRRWKIFFFTDKVNEINLIDFN